MTQCRLCKIILETADYIPWRGIQTKRTRLYGIISERKDQIFLIIDFKEMKDSQ